MADFRKGTQLIKDTADAKGGAKKFKPTIYWNEGDVRTVVFVTRADQIPKVRLHSMVRIPDDRYERGFRYETFLCRKDPSMASESNNQCELCDRIEHDSVERFVAQAIELEPIKQGKRVTGLEIKKNLVKRDDGTETEYPRWGLVIQGAKNFYSWLAAYDESKGDITTKAFEIQREGGGIGTKYHFFPEDSDLPDLSEVLDEMPDLDTMLEEMGSEETYAQLAEVEAGSQPSFGSNDKSPKTSDLDRISQFNKMKENLNKETKVEAY